MIAEQVNAWARRRAARAAVVAASAVVLLSGCAAGQIVQTAQQTPAIEGVNANVGPIALRAVSIAAPKDKSWPRGADVPLQLFITNTALAADTLESVRTDAAQSVQINVGSSGASAGGSPSSGSSSSGASTSAGGSGSSGLSGSASASAAGSASASVPLPIPGQKSVSVGYDPTDSSIVLRGLTGQLFPAQTVTLTFSFANAGSVRFPVSVHLTDAPSDRPSVNVAPTGE